LVLNDVADLEFSRRIKPRGSTLGGAEWSTAGASNTTDHRVALQHDTFESFILEKRDDGSFGNVSFTDVDVSRNEATLQVIIREKPRIALGAGITLKVGGLIEVLSVGLGRSSGRKNRRGDQDREREKDLHVQLPQAIAL
jgi:hypothetical protein